MSLTADGVRLEQLGERVTQGRGAGALPGMADLPAPRPVMLALVPQVDARLPLLAIVPTPTIVLWF